MRKNINKIIYFTIIITVLIIVPYTFLNLYLNSFVETFKSTFQRNVELFSNSISLSFFQWDEMYDAVINDNKKFLVEQFEGITKNYPFTEKVHIENKKPEFDSLYKISSDQTKIYVEFKIYDSFGEKNIQDKVAIAVFSAQKIGKEQVASLQKINFEPLHNAETCPNQNNFSNAIALGSR